MPEAGIGADASGLTVRVESGWLAGTAAEGGVRVFLGVPFAAPPVGERRWRPPEPPPSWTGVRPANAFGPDCPQPAQPGGALASRAGRQGEDCLQLNIWAPAAAPGQGLPVMVWLFGGGFLAGSPSDPLFDGAQFARRGVILVTVNYRVGVFGFLAHPGLTAESPHHASSNYALLDQLAALRWLRDNIAGFGGDPRRVTLFGVSAGSASASLLITSPLAEGFFQQAILESPGALRPLASLADAEAYGSRLGADVAALRRLSVEELLAKTPLFVPKIRGMTTPRVLRPIRDGWVIPRDERDAFATGRYQSMPLIVGSNRDEGSVFVTAWPIKTLEEYRAFVAENFRDRTEEALALYPAANEAEIRLRLGEIFADTQFNYGVWGLARAMARNESRTWRYLFQRRRAGQGDGPHHGDEVPFVFGTLGVPSRKGASFDAGDAALSQVMMAAWVRFAETGDPNGGGLEWPAYQPARDNHLEFGDPVGPGAGWRQDRMAFLDRYFASRAS